MEDEIDEGNVQYMKVHNSTNVPGREQQVYMKAASHSSIIIMKCSRINRIDGG
jgi:hypothetical protein